MNRFPQLTNIGGGTTDTAVGFQYTLQSSGSEMNIPRPMRDQDPTTIVNSDAGTFQMGSKMRLPPLARALAAFPAISSMPNEIWEGTVQSVDVNARIMSVIMEPMLHQNISRHAANISLEYVVQQDVPLVRPGAVFYLTIFTEKKRTSIQNAEEIRFRRMPAWSKVHINKIQTDSAQLLDCIES
ncbi:MAG: hypothetical protein Q8L44_09625 [Sulfuritalea sp.]|nr:hypothetical protein [Sulfuritalea sp.]